MLHHGFQVASEQPSPLICRKKTWGFRCSRSKEAPSHATARCELGVVLTFCQRQTTATVLSTLPTLLRYEAPGLSSLGALICGAGLWLNLRRLDFVDQDLTVFVADCRDAFWNVASGLRLGRLSANSDGSAHGLCSSHTTQHRPQCFLGMPSSLSENRFTRSKGGRGLGLGEERFDLIS